MSGRILITGGLGNLGSWITKYLASLNYEIIVLSRKETNLIENISYNFIKCDITNINELEISLNFDIDYCIHLASYNEFFDDNYPKKALEINTLGTRNLLQVLSEKKIKKFIYLSTFHVYGKYEGRIDENCDLAPKNDYASTHLFAEYYVQQFSFTHKIDFLILRLTNSYGTPTFVDSNKWYLILNDLAKSAYENKEILISSNGKVLRDFIYMEDVAISIERLLNSKVTNEIFNLSYGKSFSILSLARLIKIQYENRYNSPIEITINENDKKEYSNLIVENTKLKSYINFFPRIEFENEINKIFTLLEK